jgi:very-short-patch-repair endonuclease
VVAGARCARQGKTHAASQLQIYAAQNRAAPTESEARLWSALSAGKLGGRCRRQVVLGNRFIVDFVAPRVRLVVEVDGSYHAQRFAADARRDSKLGRLGYRGLRLPAALVMNDLRTALELVRAAL